MRYICLGVFLIISFNSIAQQHFKDTINSIKSSQKDPTSKIAQLKEFVIQYPNELTYNEKALAHHEIGIQFFKIQQLDSAIIYTKKAVALREKDPASDIYEQNRSLANLSYYSNASGDAKASRQYLEKILNNEQQDRYTIKAYIDLAYHRINIGDYFTALEYLDVITLTLQDQLTPDLALKTQLAYVLTYSEIENPKAYQEIISKHLVLTEELLEGVETYDAGAFYTNTGKLYEHLEQYKTSEAYYDKAITLYTKYNDSLSLGIVYNDLGVLASKQQLKDRASVYYKKSLSHTNDAYVNAATYDNLGYYLQTENLSEKTEYYRKAIRTLLGNKEGIDLYSFKTLKNAPYKTSLLGYYIDLGTSLLETYKKNKDKKYLIEAKEVMYLVDQLVSLIRLESYGENSKLFWINRGVDSYMLAVHICYLLNDIDGAFYFMEKNKSLLLLENLNDIQAKYTTNIPKTIINKELEIEANLLEIKEILRKSPDNKQHQQHYLNLLADKRNITQQLDTNYPSYQKTKKELKILTLKDAKAQYIKKDTYLVAYILNELDGYVMIITNEDNYFYRLKDIPNLLTEIDSFKAEVSKPLTTQDAFTSFNKQSNTLYHKLFPSKTLREQLNEVHLMIIPDYKLLEIPFEALKDDAGNYLIETTRVSYLQSASVYNTASRSVKETDKGILAIAPIHYPKSALQSLEGSSISMDNLVKEFDALLLTEEKASKVAFFEAFKNHKIVHINTHAGITNLKPWIALYDDYVHLNELYTIDNHANLVVLDACKSAEGTLVAGEGIMSLSRGFFYSGSKSVIASHWNVNEKTNNIILNSFYKHLQQGKNKEVALQLAKKEYLNTHQLAALSPYYWATMTLTGDTTSLYSRTSNNNYWYVLILLVLIPIGYIFFKKR